jgi:Big-like domain-containing protein
VSSLPRPTAFALAAVGASVLTACSGPRPGTAPTAHGTASATSSSSQPWAASALRLTTGAADGERHASVGRAGDAKVAGGKILSVTLTAAGGRPVRGTVAGDHRRWSPDPTLAHGTSYRLVVRASDEGGRAETRSLSFTTLAKDDRLIGTFTPEDGSTVGVVMPVSLAFNKPVTDKNKTVRFTVGRRQVSTVDTIAPDNGRLNGWNMSWQRWKAGSALAQGGSPGASGRPLHLLTSLVQTF